MGENQGENDHGRLRSADPAGFNGSQKVFSFKREEAMSAWGEEGGLGKKGAKGNSSAAGKNSWGRGKGSKVLFFGGKGGRLDTGSRPHRQKAPEGPP